MRIDLGARSPHASDHRPGHVVHRLLRPEPGDGVSVVALHRLTEFRVGRDGQHHAGGDACAR